MEWISRTNQESDLDLRTSIEDDKLFISNENLHRPGSPVSHVFEDTRAPDSFAE